jgi:hypothetical protein
MDFFNASAQILPVIFLALVFDQRSLAQQEHERWLDVAGDFAVLLAFPIGEGICVYALAAGRGFFSARETVVACLAIEMSGLVAPHLGRGVAFFVRTPRTVTFLVLAVAMVAGAGLVVAVTRSSPPSTAVYAEVMPPQLGATTFRNTRNASFRGPDLHPGQVVQVQCRRFDPSIPSVRPDGYWYEIASPPWNGRYYAAANVFLNGDRPRGPYRHNTDFAVPVC